MNKLTFSGAGVDFKIGEELIAQIDLFNQVLKSLGSQKLEENEVFIFNQGFSGTFFLEFMADYSLTGSVPLTFCFEGEGLRIDIDGIPEAVVFSNKEILEENDRVFKFLSRLLMCRIEMERYGGIFRTSRISFLDRDSCVMESLVLRGFEFVTKLYQPKKTEYSPYFEEY